MIKRYLLGMEHAVSPVEARGERFWLGAYGMVAAIYRVVVMLGIAQLVAGQYFIVGAALAALAVAQMIGLPVLRGLRYLACSAALRRQRRRAVLGVFGLVALLGVLLFGIPLPHATISEGVVWVPEEAALRAGADGAVVRLLVAPDTDVTATTSLIEMEDPVTRAEVEVDHAEVAVLEGRYLAVNLIDRPQALLVHEALERARARLEAAEQHQAELAVITTRPGHFVVPDASRLVGRFVRKGTLLGFVISAGDPNIHVVVPQSDIDLVRRETRAVAIRFSENIGDVLPARVVRETPAALDHVPAPGLSQDGGGPMLIDPSSADRDRPLERFYQLEVEPLDTTKLVRIGSHAWVRFALPPEPVAWRLLRSLQQIFLRRLDV